MKKIVCFIALAVTCYSCSLEVEPLDRYSDNVAWNDKDALDLYVKGFYAALRDNAEIYNNQLSDGLSDILKYSVNNLNGNTYQNKVLLQPNFITPSNGVLSSWGNYDRIKLMNEFLYDASTKGAHLDPGFIAIRKAEVRFLRAYLYFKMIRNHGGVILRLENTGADGGLDNQHDANKPRASEKESWDFVIKELEESGAALEGHSWTSADFGRITSGASYSLLTRCALYAKQYKKVISFGKKVEEMGYTLDPSYSDVFTNINNKEIILPVLFALPDYPNYFDRYFGPTGDFPNRGGWACPTVELVSHYPVKVDGQWEDFDWNDSEMAAHPYENRDPRFYASILYNGATWRGRKIETYVGGKDGFIAYDPTSNTPGNVTGYFMRKFLDDENRDVDNGSDSYWIEIRYAEVLLNMAEAYGQTGNMSMAYAYLNKVRTRGGTLNPRPAGSSLSVFMNYLETERMVELAFEGFRYWDLRRWRKAEDEIKEQRVHGIKITKGAGGSFNYEKVAIEKTDRVFPEKYYYMPIPQSEISGNNLCKQNPFW